MMAGRKGSVKRRGALEVERKKGNGYRLAWYVKWVKWGGGWGRPKSTAIQLSVI